MTKCDLNNDEVILYEDFIINSEYTDELEMTLTSQKIIFEDSEKIIDIIDLKDIKIYNEKVQIHQKGLDVAVQTLKKNIVITFSNILKANKFVRLIIDTVTGKTLKDRNVERIKGAIDAVDDVLGIDTRGTIKGAVENGIAGSLLNGIKIKPNDKDKKNK